jgi:phosphoesterase RecJ-like protein
MTVNTDPNPVKNRVETISEFLEPFNEKVEKAQRIILFLHKSPDLDSAGANFGISNYLKTFNSNAEIIILSSDKPSQNLLHQINRDLQEKFEIIDPSLFEYKEGDLAISIDFSDFSRCTRNNEYKLPTFVDQAILDHHVIPEFDDKLNFISTDFMSSSTMVYNLYKEKGIKIPQREFDFLVLGLLGDSGFLRFRDRNFLMSLELVASYVKNYGEKGYFDTIENLESNKAIEEFILSGIYLNNLKYEKGADYAYTTLTMDERREKGIADDFAEITNGAMHIRNIEKTKFTFSVVQDKKEANKYNLSFRTCAGSDFVVREIAQKLGGGGHPKAAGGQIEATNIQEAIEKVKAAINELNGIRA